MDCMTCKQIINPLNTIFIRVCYLPSAAASSRGDKAHNDI